MKNKIGIGIKMSVFCIRIATTIYAEPIMLKIMRIN